VREKIEREASNGVTHWLVVQREDERILFAALFPVSEILTIWSAQRDAYDELIAAGGLGRVKSNPAKNGSSPTLYLQKRGAPSVEAAIWGNPRVQDLALWQLTGLLAEEADRSDSGAGTKYVPRFVDSRESVQRQIRARRGQQKFRDQLRWRYGNRCAVTGCAVLDILEAAHIIPYRGADDNNVENGLLLRTDIHTLFDLDLLGIEPEGLRLVLHPRLVHDPHYADLDGRLLNCAAENGPSLAALRVRFEEFQRLASRSGHLP